MHTWLLVDHISLFKKLFAENQNYLLQFYIIYCEKCFMWVGLSLFLILSLFSFSLFFLPSLLFLFCLPPSLSSFFFFLFGLKISEGKILVYFSAFSCGVIFSLSLYWSSSTAFHKFLFTCIILMFTLTCNIKKRLMVSE